eukprot:495268-Prorocentrum_lima.AAC.1
MIVLCFMRLSLHEPHVRCNIRAAHQKPGQSPRKAPIALVHLRIAILIRVRGVKMLGVKLAEFRH